MQNHIYFIQLSVRSTFLSNRIDVFYHYCQTWHENDALWINASERKEIIINFRRKSTPVLIENIQEKDIETVDS